MISKLKTHPEATQFNGGSINWLSVKELMLSYLNGYMLGTAPTQ